MTGRTTSRFGIGALAVETTMLVVAGVLYNKARDREAGTSTNNSTRAEFGVKREGAAQ